MAQLPVANKALGQHFLVDQKVIKKITQDFKDQAEAIVEVGPGPGILTEHLALHSLPFHVVDKDDRFPEYLNKFLKNDQIHIEDALQFPFQEKFIRWNFKDKKVWMVSNLPYNVSTPLLILFLQLTDIKYMTLMFQKEVADKVFSFDSKAKNTMSSLMALGQNYFEVKGLCKVAPGAFRPPPKVDSAVLSFTRRENPVIPLSHFKSYEKFLRLCFSMKRKQIAKVLKSGHPAEVVENALTKANIPSTIRSEALNLTQVQELFATITLCNREHLL